MAWLTSATSDVYHRHQAYNMTSHFLRSSIISDFCLRPVTTSYYLFTSFFTYVQSAGCFLIKRLNCCTDMFYNVLIPNSYTAIASSTCSSSATGTNYSVPRTRTKFGDRAFSVAGPVVWNSLPAAVRHADSLHSFKRRLKSHFLASRK